MATRIVGLLASAVMVASAGAYAQDSARDDVNGRMSGSYVLARPVEAAQREVDAAILRAVSGMSLLWRGYATGRLREGNRIRREVRTEVSGDQVTIAHGDASYTSRNGRWRTVREPNGQSVRLRQRVRGNRLEQVFQNDEGSKRTVYRFSGDRLTLEVTIRGSHLRAPLRYSLAYERERPTVASR